MTHVVTCQLAVELQWAPLPSPGDMGNIPAAKTGPETETQQKGQVDEDQSLHRVCILCKKQCKQSKIRDTTPQEKKAEGGKNQ